MAWSRVTGGEGVSADPGVVGGGEWKAGVVMREHKALRAGSSVGHTQDHPRILWGAPEPHVTGNAAVAQRGQVTSVGAHSRNGAELDMEPWPPPGPVTSPCHLAPWPLLLMGFTLLPSNSERPRHDTNASGHLLSLSHPSLRAGDLGGVLLHRGGGPVCRTPHPRRLRLGFQSPIIYSSSGFCLPSLTEFSHLEESIDSRSAKPRTDFPFTRRGAAGHQPPLASLPAAAPPPWQCHVSPDTPFRTQHPQPSPCSPRSPAEP